MPRAACGTPNGRAGRSSASTPRGKVTHRIALPVPKATCCAFGGADLATLYITTSRLGMTEDEIAKAPLSGALFAVRPARAGWKTPFCRLTDDHFQGRKR